ncbi:MAG: hypothetical protein HC822_10570 [Oscillochloris sp.]|nr:hypothetical protein [Oscillochloris sp.]
MRRSLLVQRRALPLLALVLAYLVAVLPLIGPQLPAVALRPAPQLASIAEPLANPDAVAAFAALQARSADPLAVFYHPQSGRVEFLSAVDAAGRIPYTPTDIERGNPVAIARGFLDQQRDLFGLQSVAKELTFLRREPDRRLGFSHLRFGQTYRGLPVFGRQLVVHLDAAEQIVAVNGQFSPDIALPTEPAITPELALDTALTHLRAEQLTPFELARVQIEPLPESTELTIYLDQAGRPRLVWMVQILTSSPLAQWRYFVNALRPEVVHAIDEVMPIKRRQTFTARNSTRIPGRLIIDEGERSRDPVAQAAHDGAGAVYDYFFQNFERDSIDDRGMTLVSTVNYGSDPQDAENAAWVSEYNQMIYGDGGRIFEPLPFGLDVVGHEFTHGVIDATSQLIYENQSGALNESYADIFGVMIDRANWTIGEAVIKSPPYPVPYLRSLRDPNAEGFYEPRDPLRGVGQPAHMDEYANLPNSRRSDNGGVHINSGIPNRAAYLVAQAIGRERAEQVFYRALTQYLTPRSDFLDAANAAQRAAADLYGNEIAAQVRAGYEQVGITTTEVPDAPPVTPDSDLPDIPPGPAGQEPLPANCSDVIVNGGFELEDGWEQVAARDIQIIDPQLPRNGRRSAWLGGSDQEALQYIYQDVRLPPNATSIELRYSRLLHEETTGLLGLLAGEAYFSTVIADRNGDLLATLAELPSSAGDDVWRDERYDLIRFAGDQIRVVFASENPRGNVSSMFVDDVRLIACTGGQGPAAPPTANADLVYVQGTIVDSATARGVNGAQVFILRPGVTARQAAADDNLSPDEVLTYGTTDRSGLYRTRDPVPRGQTYSVIVVANGYRPILADGEVVIPRNATNPYRVDAELRRS